MQETPWVINTPVLEALRWAWDTDQEIGGMPSKHDLDLPVYPFEVSPHEMTTTEEREALKAWSGRRAAVYDHNNRTMSKRIAHERTLQLAEEYNKYDEFYFVWTNDFRGRKYTVESFLSPQVADWGKSLITFARGVTIEDEHDADWLAIHGANLFGVDKVSLDDRVLWAYMNEENVVRTVENYHDFEWWKEADKPWQALAWCFEWYGYLREGKGYVTHLPVHADGSCNGLQHLSAILRDEQGARAVNLTPSSKPQDIYTDVALKTVERVKMDAANGDEMAQQCLEFGIDRKITKRSVMIVPYSGTLMSCREYIAEALKEKADKGQYCPWDNYFPPSKYLSHHVWESIQEVISSAATVMDYLRVVGSHCAKQNKAMEWVTPTNLLVRQAYPQLSHRTIKTMIDGSVVKLSYQDYQQDLIDLNRTRNGSSPNFIHSMDASALTLTIDRCKDIGIDDFAMVHDSYGTHAPNMPAMSQLLREAFVDMYEKHDVLQELKDHVESYTEGALPEPPAKGSLNLHNVLESKYFFA
jgi:DNA-directed RNA polymerase